MEPKTEDPRGRMEALGEGVKHAHLESHAAGWLLGGLAFS
jgi:hypothetical protein